MSGLHHDGLLRPDELLDAELGLGLVYPLDPGPTPGSLAGRQGGKLDVPKERFIPWEGLRIGVVLTGIFLFRLL